MINNEKALAPKVKVKKKRGRSLEAQKALAGRMFVYPWVLGFILFFGGPLIQSVIYSFNQLTITSDGLKKTFVGWQNFKYAFFQDPNFSKTLVPSVSIMLTDVPMIIFFSLFIAVLLNKKFRGRALVRGFFFLPVIITSGALVYVMSRDISSTLSGATGTNGGMPMVSAVNLRALLVEATNGAKFADYVMNIIDRVYVIIWKSGVQILLFLAGLQSISPSLYESADVEGATGWESFWKITFPMISPIILINIVYTVIDSFTDYNNEMLRYIVNAAFVKVQYGYSAALAWIYFGVIMLILGSVIGVISRRVFYMNE